jgi:hypothetical protein
MQFVAVEAVLDSSGSKITQNAARLLHRIAAAMLATNLSHGIHMCVHCSCYMIYNMMRLVMMMAAGCTDL